MQQVMLAILGTFFFCLFLAGMGGGGFLLYKSRKRQIESQDQFCEAVKSLSAVAKDLSDVPKLIAGHGTAAVAITREVAKLREAVEAFTGIVAKPKEDKAGVDYTKEEDASMHWSVAEVMLENPEMNIGRAKEVAEERMSELNALPNLGME